MALVVEDGSMPVGSNTFISFADANTYATDRGLWPSATTDDAKTVALLRAADYLNTLQWKGIAVTWDRVMAWPRENVPQPGGATDIYGNPVLLANNIVPITNGALGLKGIPKEANLWWNFGWCVVTLIIIARLINSNAGNVLKAIRDDEVAAKAMGIDVFRWKLISFTLGAFFAGMMC